jgi:hypothetical protein
MTKPPLRDRLSRTYFEHIRPQCDGTCWDALTDQERQNHVDVITVLLDEILTDHVIMPAPAPVTELRYQRLSREWSLTDVANRVGYTKGYVSHLECGRRRASGNTMQRFAAVFECAPEWLWHIEEGWGIRPRRHDPIAESQSHQPQ